MVKDMNNMVYTWNDEDCVYWADDVDDRYYCEIPKNAIFTLK